MPVEAVRANRKVEDDAGKIALVRGPLVYALESVDNGDELQSLLVPAEQSFRLAKAKGLPKGTVAISGDAWRDVRDDAGELYTTAKPKFAKKRFTAIPFALWQNRGPAEMSVWIREKLF